MNAACPQPQSESPKRPLALQELDQKHSAGFLINFLLSSLSGKKVLTHEY